MKSDFNFIPHSFYFIFLIFTLFIILLVPCNSFISFPYPSAVSLLNSNFFIVEQKGIYIYDSEFKNIIYSFPFTEEEQINNLYQLSEVIIKIKNDYLICLINSKIYFFDELGTQLFFKSDNIFLDDEYYHPTLAPIFIKDNNYYFVLGYFLSSNKLKLILFSINLSTYSSQKVAENIDDDFESYFHYHYNFQNKGLSCEYMIDNNEYKYYFLICFFIIQDTDEDELTESFYEISESEIKPTFSYRTSYIESSSIKNAIQIKTFADRNQQNALVSLLFSTKAINYYKFRCEYGSFNKFSKFYETSSTNFNCRNSLYSMKLTYLINNNNIILSCINTNSIVQAIIFTDGLTTISSYSQFSSCKSIFGHNIVYSMKNFGYYIISDVVCGKYKRSFEPLEGQLEEITESLSITTMIEDNSLQNYEFEYEEKNDEEEKEEKEKEKEKEKEGKSFEEEEEEEEKEKKEKIIEEEEKVENENEKLKEEKEKVEKEKLIEEQENLEEVIEKEEITDINKQSSEFESDQRIFDDNITLEYQDEFLKKLKDDFMKGFNSTKLDKGEDIFFNLGKITYTLTTTDNQRNNKNNNSSSIDLGKCENKLKQENNISLNNSLYILKVDKNIDHITKVEYELYYPFSSNNLTLLDLSVCKNLKIEISIPINIPLDDIDKYNKSSALYNDLCYTSTTEDGTDKPLKERQNEFMNSNLSICEEDCDFTEYDNINKKAICSCFTKLKLPLISEIKVDKKKMFSNFKDIKNIANFKILNCIYLLFDIKNAFKNAANYIFIILLILIRISFIVFICHDYFKIKILVQQMDYKKNINNTENIKEKECTKLEINEIKNEINKNNNENLNVNGDKALNNLILNKKRIYIKTTINNNQDSKRKLKIKKVKKRKKRIETNVVDKKDNYDIPYLNLKNKEFYFFNDEEMNSLDYESAQKKDKRTYVQYHLSLLRTKHILLLTFFNWKDYNSQTIKIYIFFYTFSINFLISAMFYSDSTMHKIYIDKGSFDFTYQLPLIIYSSIISSVLTSILNNFGLYESNLIELKCDKDKIAKDTLLTNKCKIIFFFIFSYVLLIFIWIYLGCFCAVYKNTQIHILKDVSLSFSFSFITPFFIYLIPGILRIPSLKEKANRPLLFKASKILQML